ncbi:CDP-alcohol phosphatidyltransferase family protein [Nocardioides albus]|uniref:Phosphatidylglycerophosphate synthase n=1 Tax=Nocardioides albus TaxID=1841 RepID=A0A7W4ZZX9_9ACTN|nr:CDP-alcohol phosphatidyltransferase family protein [Nocardioides albus]MBB3087142.1 phosphatidylglycerophosphate synthase [Nocardioides albus]GGU06924.1 CDP-alcohol phosphatidyltransferase [Nocardioides albus]
MAATGAERAPGGFRAHLEALGQAQKPSLNTAAYSRLVNRPAGRVVAAAAHTLGAATNQVTALSATLSAAGLLVLALVEPHWWTGILVAVLLATGYVLDSSDGQLARLRGGGSRSGEWLDHTIDCFKTATLHLAVLVSWYRFGPATDGWLLVPLGFEVVAVVTYFGLILMPTLRPSSAGSSAAVPENPLRKWALLPIDYGAQCWMFVLLGFGVLFQWTYLLVFVCNAAALAIALRKWWRELRALDGSS